MHPGIIFLIPSGVTEITVGNQALTIRQDDKVQIRGVNQLYVVANTVEEIQGLDQAGYKVHEPGYEPDLLDETPAPDPEVAETELQPSTNELEPSDNQTKPAGKKGSTDSPA